MDFHLRVSAGTVEQENDIMQRLADNLVAIGVRKVVLLLGDQQYTFEAGLITTEEPTFQSLAGSRDALESIILGQQRKE